MIRHYWPPIASPIASPIVSCASSPSFHVHQFGDSFWGHRLVYIVFGATDSAPLSLAESVSPLMLPDEKSLGTDNSSIAAFVINVLNNGA